MLVNVLFNSLSERDKMREWLSILLLFHNMFNKFENTRAQMLDSIYHMTLQLLNITFLVLKVKILSLCMQHCYERQNILLQTI